LRLNFSLFLFNDTLSTSNYVVIKASKRKIIQDVKESVLWYWKTLSTFTWTIKDEALKWGFCRTCLIKSNSKSTKGTESLDFNMFLISFILLKFKCQTNEKKIISMFHRAFFNSIMDKTPTHALFYSTLY